MNNVLAINGSPKMAKGRTAMVLTPFLDELEKQGANINLLYASRLKIKPCNCGRLYCWNNTPGHCIHKDEMEQVIPLLKQANILVFATPVYIPLPGEMQMFINRMTPLLDPQLEFIKGRTRIRFREDVQIDNIVLVATGGWWEKGNCDIVTQIIEHIASISQIPFGGAIIRPHAYMMKKDEQLTEDGKAVVQSIRKAAHELLETGEMTSNILEQISRPLISSDSYFNRGN